MLSKILPRGTEKKLRANVLMINVIRAKIQTRNLPNKKQ
jgi:hypothetical protein